MPRSPAKTRSAAGAKKAPNRKSGGGSGRAPSGPTQAEVGALLGITERQVRTHQRRDADPMPRGGLPEIVQWFVRFKVEEASRREEARTAPTTRAAAEDREAIAKAELLELRLARERGDVVSREGYRRELAAVVGALRRSIDNLRGEYGTRFLHLDSPAKVRTQLRVVQDDLLTTLASSLSTLPLVGDLEAGDEDAGPEDGDK